jgi:hypothetical protein
VTLDIDCSIGYGDAFLEGWIWQDTEYVNFRCYVSVDSAATGAAVSCVMTANIADTVGQLDLNYRGASPKPSLIEKLSDHSVTHTALAGVVTITHCTFRSETKFLPVISHTERKADMHTGVKVIFHISMIFFVRTKCKIFILCCFQHI